MPRVRSRQTFGPDRTWWRLHLAAITLLLLAPPAMLLPRLALWPTSMGSPVPDSRAAAGLAVIPGVGLGYLLLPLVWLGLAAVFAGYRQRPMVQRALSIGGCLLAASTTHLGTAQATRRIWPERLAGLARAGERAQPLIDALNAYHHDHGQSAPSLAALVPAYLPAVPGTGLVGYPEFRYEPEASTVERWPLSDGRELRVYQDGGWPAWSIIEPRATTSGHELEWRRADAWRRQLQTVGFYHLRGDLPPPASQKEPPEGGWRLGIRCGLGLNFDEFYYLPTQRYARYAHGGETERVGRWAYVRE